MSEGQVLPPRHFLIDSRPFVAVRAVGKDRNSALPFYALVLHTVVHGHILSWTLVGPTEQGADALAACTLQIDGRAPSSLMP